MLNHERHKRQYNIVVWFADWAHVTEDFHLLKNIVDAWHHILAINHDRLVGAVPQSHMEHSSALDAQRKLSQALYQL